MWCAHKNVVFQGCTNSGFQVTQAITFCIMAPNICGFSVLILLHVTQLSPRILRWLLDFWSICGPLCYFTSNSNDYDILCKVLFILKLLW
jgi:hypothetical protein